MSENKLRNRLADLEERKEKKRGRQIINQYAQHDLFLSKKLMYIK